MASGDGSRRSKTAGSKRRVSGVRRKRREPEWKLYLVRWPDLTAALVRAVDERDLAERLDELGDPGGCMWTEYDGPLWVELELPAKVRLKPHDGLPRAADVEVTVEAETVEMLSLRARIPETDTADEFQLAVLRGAFPHVAEVVEEADALEDVEDGAEIARLEAAMRADLVPMLQHGWRRAQQSRRARGGDVVAAFREIAGVTTDLHDAPRRRPRK